MRIPFKVVLAELQELDQDIAAEREVARWDQPLEASALDVRNEMLMIDALNAAAARA